MRSPMQDMLTKYNCKSPDDFRNAIKEIIQEIVLLGLSRTSFFNRCAFYGGTALRIFYGLNRFSEDLDFTLLKPDPGFDLNFFFPAVRDELGAFGFDMKIERKQKSEESTIQSAFIKGGTQIQLAKIISISPPVTGISEGELIRIKFEIDTDPPEGAGFEMKYQLLPVPYSVRLYDLPSLFAGKIHALLCRNWKTRVKGRDFYDYIWYLSHEVPLNMLHLKKRLEQSGHLKNGEDWDRSSLIQRLERRFSSVDYSMAKKDILPFIKNAENIDLWNFEFYNTITKDKLQTQFPPRK